MEAGTAADSRVATAESGKAAARCSGEAEESEEERFMREAREKALLNAQLQAARLNPKPEHATLSNQGQVISKLLSDIAAEADEEKLTESVSIALQGVDLNARYVDADGEQMTCGHKLALETIHLPQASGPFKMALVEELVRSGLDVKAEWRDGRAVGTCGCAVLSSVFWLQGVEEKAKVAMVKEVLKGGLDLNAEYVERATRATCGTFLMAGATHCPQLEGSTKVEILSTLLEAGMDLNLPCKQGKTPSTTANTIAGRVCTAVKTQPAHQAAMYAKLVLAGWDVGQATDKVKGHALLLLQGDALDPSVREALRRAMAASPSPDSGAAATAASPVAAPG